MGLNTILNASQRQRYSKSYSEYQGRKRACRRRTPNKRQVRGGVQQDRYLKILNLNICEINERRQYPEFTELIAQYNVVGLVQTKTVDSDTIHLLGYTVFTKNQRKLHVAKVWSEGITVAGKDALKKINILDDIPRKRKFTLYEGQSKYEDFCYSYVIKRHIITKIKYTYLRNCF